MEDWEKNLGNIIDDIKDYAGINKEDKFTATFRGIFTLKNAYEVQRLATLADTLVVKSVDLFHFIQKEGQNFIISFKRDIEDTVNLSAKFTEIAVNEDIKNRSLEIISQLRFIEGELKTVLNRQTPGQKIPPERVEQMTIPLKKFLDKLHTLADIMDQNQMLILEKGIVNLRQELDKIYRITASDFAPDHRIKGFKIHYDALIKLTENRILCLTKLQEDGDTSVANQKTGLEHSLNDIKSYGEKLLLSTKKNFTN